MTETYRRVEGGVECSCCSELTPWKRAMRHRPGCPAVEGLKGLTEREMQVVLMRSRGLSSRDIAYDTRMTIKTVDTHLRNAKDKLGVYDLALVTRMVVEWERQEIAEGRPPKTFRGERAPGVMAGIG